VPEKVDLQVQLPRAACGPRLARWVMRSWFAGSGADVGLADAELLVSELVTNALVHGEGHIILRACLDEDRLLVEVIDQRSTFKRQLWRRDGEQTGRWGLDLVKDISSRWGANEGMTHVWFELEQLRT
jgi:anti-sigma regulatory factor (Ser/Thr protein kinase)